MKTYISTTTATDWRRVVDCPNGSRDTINNARTKGCITPPRRSGMNRGPATEDSPRHGKPCNARAVAEARPASSWVERASPMRQTSSKPELEIRPPVAVEKETSKKRRGRATDDSKPLLSLS